MPSCAVRTCRRRMTTNNGLRSSLHVPPAPPLRPGLCNRRRQVAQAGCCRSRLAANTICTAGGSTPRSRFQRRPSTCQQRRIARLGAAGTSIGLQPNSTEWRRRRSESRHCEWVAITRHFIVCFTRGHGVNYRCRYRYCSTVPVQYSTGRRCALTSGRLRRGRRSRPSPPLAS